MDNQLLIYTKANPDGSIHTYIYIYIYHIFNDYTWGRGTILVGAGSPLITKGLQIWG